MPKYSIITAAYNVERYIGEAVCSVLAQTEPDWELIIVDDGSTDGTLARLRQYQDDRIKLLRQRNGGPARARNAGLAQSIGDRVLFLDADDRLYSYALHQLGAALDRNPTAVASYGQTCIIDADGRRLGQMYKPRRGHPPSGDLLATLVTKNLFANGGHVCIEGSVARTLRFRTDLPFAEDHECWCHLAAKGPIIYAGERPVLDYRRHPQNLTTGRARTLGYYEAVVNRVFSDPKIIARFDMPERKRLRRLAEANVLWSVAREHIRANDWIAARRYLVESLFRRWDHRIAAILVLAFCGGGPESLQRRIRGA